MRLLVKLAIASTGMFMLASLVHAETVFEKLVTLYDQGQKPAITQFATDAVWAGKCVERVSPDQVVGGVFNTFVSNANDPIVNQHRVWGMVHLAPDNTRDDYFLEMDKDQAVYLHNSVRGDLKKYTEIQDNKPEFNELIFTYREKDLFGRITGGVDYTAREVTVPENVKMYVLAGRCPFENCSANMVYRDRFVMCYVWEDKLAQP